MLARGWAGTGWNRQEHRDEATMGWLSATAGSGQGQGCLPSLTLLHPCCLCQDVPPARVPRFPSFLAQAGETAAVCETPGCCWQVFLLGLTLCRRTLPWLCRWPCQPEPGDPGSQTHPLCPFLRPAVTPELSPGLLADRWLCSSQMPPAPSRQGHPNSHLPSSHF